MEKVRIVLADDHQIILDGLKMLIDDMKDIEIVGEAANGREAVKMVKEHEPDIVIMDVAMPELNGIEATRQISSECPDVKIIVLSMHSEKRFVSLMFKAGAKAYLSKENAFKELSSAIRAVMAGTSYLSPNIATALVEDYVEVVKNATNRLEASTLSPRELEVMQLLAEGRSTRETAETLYVSIKTVEAHRRNIMEKLGLKGVAELTRYAIREGYIAL
jgi:DNA-binding NarL/FixJ family response regulator